MKDKKAACFRKQISPGFFVQKLCSLWHLQVASAVLVVLVAICKSQLAVCKKALKKPHVKVLMKSTQGLRFVLQHSFSEKLQNCPQLNSH
jgi:hypothetical protein